MTAFDRAFQDLVMVERGYSDHPSDTGGKTMYGITEAVARAHGWKGDMKDLPLDTAKEIYRAQYWDLLRLDPIAALSEPIAFELFDTGVNCGVGVAAKFLQRALNSFNRQARDYADMHIDCVIGPMTITALRAYLALRGHDGEVVMLRALNDQQGTRYIELGEMRAENEDFEFGWFLKRVA